VAHIRFGRSKIQIRTPSDKLIDLIGQRFGRLVVVRRAERNNERGAARWACRCDCDATALRFVRGDSLRSGASQSCGCVAIEATRQRAADRPKLDPQPRKPRVKRRPPQTSSGDWRSFAAKAVAKALSDLK
jgi:hypothetical protein